MAALASPLITAQRRRLGLMRRIPGRAAGGTVKGQTVDAYGNPIAGSGTSPNDPLAGNSGGSYPSGMDPTGGGLVGGSYPLNPNLIPRNTNTVTNLGPTNQASTGNTATSGTSSSASSGQQSDKVNTSSDVNQVTGTQRSLSPQLESALTGQLGALDSGIGSAGYNPDELSKLDLSPEEQAGIISQSTRGIAGAADNARQQLIDRAAAAGNYAPGVNATMERVSQDQERNAAEAQQAARLGIMGAQRAGAEVSGNARIGQQDTLLGQRNALITAAPEGSTAGTNVVAQTGQQTGLVNSSGQTSGATSATGQQSGSVTTTPVTNTSNVTNTPMVGSGGVGGGSGTDAISNGSGFQGGQPGVAILPGPNLVAKQTGARAKGGPVGLRGAGSYVVGEKGPEILKMAPGSHGYVIPHHAIAAIMPGRAEGGPVGDDLLASLAPDAPFDQRAQAAAGAYQSRLDAKNGPPLPGIAPDSGGSQPSDPRQALMADASGHEPLYPGAGQKFIAAQKQQQAQQDAEDVARLNKGRDQLGLPRATQYELDEYRSKMASANAKSHMEMLEQERESALLERDTKQAQQPIPSTTHDIRPILAAAVPGTKPEDWKGFEAVDSKTAGEAIKAAGSVQEKGVTGSSAQKVEAVKSAAGIREHEIDAAAKEETAKENAAAKASAETDKQAAAGMKWVQYTDPTTGRQAAGPLSEAKKFGATDPASLGGSDVTTIREARMARELATKTGTTPDTMGVLQLIDSLDKDGKLGVAASRFNSFMSGGVGAEPGDDPRIMALMNKSENLMMVHMKSILGMSGGRSPATMQRFMDMANAKKMNANTLRDGIKAVSDIAKDRAMLPSGGQSQGPSQGAIHVKNRTTGKTGTFSGTPQEAASAGYDVVQ